MVWMGVIVKKKSLKLRNSQWSLWGTKKIPPWISFLMILIIAQHISSFHFQTCVLPLSPVWSEWEQNSFNPQRTWTGTSKMFYLEAFVKHVSRHQEIHFSRKLFTWANTTIIYDTTIIYYKGVVLFCLYSWNDIVFGALNAKKSTSSFLTRMFSEKHYWFWLCH